MTSFLRLATCGSVDDGKSTLIGRLLVDARAVLDDQLDHVREVTARRGGDGLDLALLTDGLRAEREQGITIDVAYRYFATARRTFVLADCPGHVQYTRNMVTGISTTQLALVLVDATRGVTEQTRRHLAIASLLGVRHLVVCVNKMDAAGWDQATFDAIATEARALARIELCVPLSALHGDNVVERSEHTPWYEGPPLLRFLEEVEVDADLRGTAGARLPVQLVIRGDGERRYAGRVAGGVLRPGDEVVVLPSGIRTRLAAVETFDGPLEEAEAPRSVTVRLEGDVDVARGDLIAAVDAAPVPAREIDAVVCWMAERPLRAGARLALKHTTNSVRGVVDAVDDRLDLATMAHLPDPGELGLNDIGRVRLRTSAPVMADPYAANRTTGAFILIDEATNDTVGAGLVGAA